MLDLAEAAGFWLNDWNLCFDLLGRIDALAVPPVVKDLVLTPILEGEEPNSGLTPRFEDRLLTLMRWMKHVHAVKTRLKQEVDTTRIIDWHLKNQLDVTTNERDAATNAAEALVIEKANLLHKIDKMEAVIANAQIHIAALEGRVAQAGEELVALRRSVSWRLTGPLRRVMRLLRGGG